MKNKIIIIGLFVIAAIAIIAAVLLSVLQFGKEEKVNSDKILVVYFSRAGENYNVGEVEVGNTELLAKEIVRKTGADEFKIVPVNPYPENYQEAIDKATAERNAQARPEYVGDIDLSNYDTIFFGYPIWWGDMPMIVYNFLEKHDFSGKTVIPFNTHEGSGNAGTYSIIKSKIPNANVVGDGFNISGSTARTENGLRELNNWLDKLGF